MKIDKNIPIPSITGRYMDWPFGEMKIGDSIEVDKESCLRARTAASYFSKRNPEFFFTIRKHGGAYRCWRVQPKTKPAK